MESTECKLTVKESSLALVLGFVFAQISVFVLLIIASLFASPFVGATKVENFLNHNAWGYLLCTIALDLALFGVFFYFNNKKQNKIVTKPTAKKCLIYILIAVATFFCLAPIVNCFDTFLIKLKIPLNDMPYKLNLKTLFPSILSFVILPPIFEELLFRGLIFKGLKQYGKAFSVIFTALFFAIFHMSIDQFIYQLLFGLILSIIMYKENNIIYTILMHTANNLLAFLFTYFDIALMVNHWAFVLLAIALAIAYLALVLLLIFKGNKNCNHAKLGNYKAYFIVSFAMMIILWIVLVLVKIFGN